MAEHQFLAMWCNEGLEYVGDYTEHSQAKTWAALANKPCNSTFPNPFHLELRARYNSQRHYEIYTFNAADGITAEDIREMFEADPQYAADLIREKGQRIYSDRANSNHVKIV